MEKQNSKINEKETHKEVAKNNISKKDVFKYPKKDTPLELIVTGVPTGYPVNSTVPANTAVQMPNAQVYGDSNVPLCYLDGSEVPGGYASPGNDIKILEIFEGMLLVLVPVGSGAEGNGQWVIGYMETSVLGNTVWINANTVTWNNANEKVVYDSNGNTLCIISATQPIQFLYETPNNDYACILFNDSDGNLLTGYVPMYYGTFYRQDYLPSSPYPNAPGILNGGSTAPGSSNPGYEDSVDTVLIQFNYFLNKLGFSVSQGEGSYQQSISAPGGVVTLSASLSQVTEVNDDATYQLSISNGTLTVSDTIIHSGLFADFNINVNGTNLFDMIVGFSYGNVKVTLGGNSFSLKVTKNVYDENNNEFIMVVNVTASYQPNEEDNDDNGDDNNFANELYELTQYGLQNVVNGVQYVITALPVFVAGNAAQGIAEIADALL